MHRRSAATRPAATGAQPVGSVTFTMPFTIGCTSEGRRYISVTRRNSTITIGQLWMSLQRTLAAAMQSEEQISSTCACVRIELAPVVMLAATSANTSLVALHAAVSAGSRRHAHTVDVHMQVEYDSLFNATSWMAIGQQPAPGVAVHCCTATSMSTARDTLTFARIEVPNRFTRTSRLSAMRARPLLALQTQANAAHAKSE